MSMIVDELKGLFISELVVVDVKIIILSELYVLFEGKTVASSQSDCKI
jgi:hypothetical protein